MFINIITHPIVSFLVGFSCLLVILLGTFKKNIAMLLVGFVFFYCSTVAYTIREHSIKYATGISRAYDQGAEKQRERDINFITRDVDFTKVPVKGDEYFFLCSKLKFSNGKFSSQEILWTLDYYPILKKE